jgi:pimeloyl-ACP methyl ester carboxylesterase
VTWTVVAILLGVLALDFTLRCLAARLILPIFERKPPFGGAPHADPSLGERILIPTTNGLWLCGRIYRQSQTPPRGVIVFCPEMEGDSTSALFYCAALLEAGFDVLGFDFRNQAESGSLPGYEPLHWPTEYEVEDALSAVRYVQSREEWSELPVGVVGISRGGGAALGAASRNPRILRVVAESAFSTERLMEHYTLRWAALYIPQWLMNLFPLWHIRGTLALVRLFSQLRRRCRYVSLDRELSRLNKTPILLIHGDRDSYVPKETALGIARTLPELHSFWLVENANHNKAREVDAEEYDRRLVEFFEPILSHADMRPDASHATLLTPGS